MIEKYKVLEAENERLKALNVELTAKCNWYNSDGARLERERDELKRQLAEYKADAERYRNIKPIIDAFPEINPSNYDHDDACGLNAWGVELVLADEAMKGEKE